MNKRSLSIFVALIISWGLSGSPTWAQNPVICVGEAGYETLAKAVTALGSTAVTLVVPQGGQQIVSDLTIPNNITLKILQGANIQIASNVTLRIQGPFTAGGYQVFADNSGNLVKGVKFAQTCGLLYVRPEWWGAIGVYYTVDCTPAINLAINSGDLLPDGTYYRIPVQFSAGDYLCCGTINVVAGTTLLGVSGGCSFLEDNTVLALPNGATYSLIAGNQANGVCLQNLSFMPSGVPSGKLVNLSGGGSGGSITGCQFYTYGYPADGSAWAIYLDNHSQILIDSNYFVGNGGVFMNGAQSQFTNNEVAGGENQTIGVYVKSADTVHSNIFFGCYAGIILSQCSGAQIYNNRFDQCNYAIHNLGGSGGTTGVITITGNRLANNILGYVCDSSSTAATLDTNNFIDSNATATSGTVNESVSTAAVLVNGDGTILTNNRFENNVTNIAGSGQYQASENFGIDVPM